MILALALLLFAAPDDGVRHYEGEVSQGQSFRRAIGRGLIFELKPTDTGWRIAIVPEAACEDHSDFAMVVNPPYRGYNALNVDASYGTTVTEAVGMPPRKFRFVLSCRDYRVEGRRLDIVLWPYRHPKPEYESALAKLGTSPQGHAIFTILRSKTSKRIDWIRFRLKVCTQASAKGCILATQ